MNITITDFDFNKGWVVCDFLRNTLKFSRIQMRITMPGVKHVILPSCSEYHAFEVEIFRPEDYGFADGHEIYFYDSDRSPICFVKREKKLTFVRFNASLHVLSVDGQLVWE